MIQVLLFKYAVKNSFSIKCHRISQSEVLNPIFVDTMHPLFVYIDFDTYPCPNLSAPCIWLPFKIA